jgi:hypothetical protein
VIEKRCRVEPNLAVADELAPVLKELMRLEPLFHAAADDATPQRFEELVASEFWEVGASGRRYSREFVLSVLSSRPRDPAEDDWKTSGFHVLEVANDNYLLTYTLQQPGRITRRATLWRRVGGSWNAVYHQGTVVQEEL